MRGPFRIATLHLSSVNTNGVRERPCNCVINSIGPSAWPLLFLRAAFLLRVAQHTAALRKAGAEAPPAPNVVPVADAALFTVARPDQFPLAAATARPATSELIVTGTVTPDVSKQVPVPSLATGRIVEIDVRLGDQVTRGQLLFKVRSADIAGAFSSYRQAVKNEGLTKIQLDRANILFARGAIPKSTQEIAQNAEDDNLVVLETAKEQLGLFGVDPDNPDRHRQRLCPGGGNRHGPADHEPVGRAVLFSAESVHDFRPVVHLGDLRRVRERFAERHDGRHGGHHAECLSRSHVQWPGEQHRPILDPNIRTAKVRIEVRESRHHAAGHVREGHVPRSDEARCIPLSRRPPILHMHDRDFVYFPAPATNFAAWKSWEETCCRTTRICRRSIGTRCGTAGGHQCPGAGPRARPVTQR